MIDPATAAMIAGTVSSLFGPKPKLTAAQKLQLQVARQFQHMGNAPPLSNADELAGLAQQRGMLGLEQGQATGQVLAAQPYSARGNNTDLMSNLASSQAGERGGLDLQAIMESIARNRQALLTSAQVAGSVGQPTTRQNDIPALFGQLASQYYQRQAMKQANQGGGGAGAQNQGSMWPTYPQRSYGRIMGPPGAGGGQQQPTITGQGGALHSPPWDPMTNTFGPPTSPMPAFAQSQTVAPALSPASPGGGASGVLGAWGPSSAAPALTPGGMGVYPPKRRRPRGY